MIRILQNLTWHKTIGTIFLLMLAVSVNADEQRKIKLDENHSKETVHLAFCNVFVAKENTDDDRNARVSVEIENLDESNVIILFGRSYPEKELKKLSPSITFDKNFPGTKGRRNIDSYRKARTVIFIDPSEKKRLSEIVIEGEEGHLCRLPFYIAKYKKKSFFGGSNGRNKLLLMEKQTLELEIDVELKPDNDYARINNEATALISDIGTQVFCTNTKHKPTLERQEKPYKERISKLQRDIDEVIDRHRWKVNDKGYQRYAEIKQKLSAINFSDYERDCGKRHGGGTPKPTQASCKYCNLSPQQIYHKLDDYYKMIYNSNNRKATKESVMSEVNLLYSCSKHAATWKNSDYQQVITDRYRRICNF